MHIIGNLSINLALILSTYSFIMFVFGIRKQSQRMINSAKGAALSVFILATISMFLMFYLLATNQFQFQYVYQNTSTDLSMFYKLSAMWAGNEGSLLLWTYILTMYTVMVVFSNKMKNNPMTPYIGAIISTNTIFFYLILAFVTPPFKTLDFVPPEGNGLNPMLQDPSMLWHPVAIYLGYVGLVVPFAFAIAALILKNIDSYWLKITRRWTIIAWLFLTLGNVIGGYWAYTELGWGGYWAWDPVENASFLPWLTVTAYLHSVMIQERKNMLKVWNMSLIILSYILTLFGTFLVRSGVLTSVHSFADGNLGTYFMIFLAFMVIFSMYILMSRYQMLRQDTGQIESVLSKESSFLMNNLILVGATFAVFWGTVFPLISEAIRGETVTVGEPFFNTVMAPIMLALMFLMAVCPLIAWQRASLKNVRDNFLIPAIFSLAVVALLVVYGLHGAYPIISFILIMFMIFTHIAEFIRGTKARRRSTNEPVLKAFWKLFTGNRRRYGGYIVHFGIALIAIGVVGANFDQERVETISPGEAISIDNYTITYEGLEQRSDGVNTVIYADMDIEKDGQELGYLQPERIFYRHFDEPSTEVAVHSNLAEDLYVVLSGWEEDDSATFVVKINPLVQWIWLGSFVTVIGSLFAIWGGRQNKVVPRYQGVQRQVS
ncbi:heme lyase CcmF/NrfE family subunit [Texcoconibacillus texcoconensis]|uniref:Cytochrome c-type biogenesis protein CcmF n=1 Tax=Texcoconibacillus texcoconensis TaxID=1095777 RepID=A0A840QU27_9BACI|nr:heme lyase CcmF/NrfE family subunit [Texcoconibacillus texcoconensis]MBB5174799.1 cytochrome c-type biogenesis protein CcmF [Texcoconibacillus texcoconensis]